VEHREGGRDSVYNALTSVPERTVSSMSSKERKKEKEKAKESKADDKTSKLRKMSTRLRGS
jgi:hypothetical protein